MTFKKSNKKILEVYHRASLDGYSKLRFEVLISIQSFALVYHQAKLDGYLYLAVLDLMAVRISSVQSMVQKIRKFIKLLFLEKIQISKNIKHIM